MSRFAELLTNTAKSLTEGGTGLSDVASSGLSAIEHSSLVPKAVASAAGNAPGVVNAKEFALGFQRLPNAFEFKTAIDGRQIGPLPRELEAAMASRTAAFSQVNGLATMLRSLDGSRNPGLKSGLAARDMGLPNFTLQAGSLPVDLSKTSFGHLGHVYELSTGDNHYALKVFSDPARMDTHGAFAETGLLTYLSKYPIRDLMQFHGANPSPSGGWMMSEFLREPKPRAGENVEDVLAREGLMLADVGGGFGPGGHTVGNRGPGGIVWDVGGIEPLSTLGVRPRSISEFAKLFDSPDGKMVAGRKVGSITQPDELKAALLLTLDHPESNGQVARSARYFMHNPKDMAEVFSKALETPGAAGRAALELDGLQGTPYFTKLFYKGLANPESRIETAKLVDHLAPNERYPGFVAAFQFPESRPMATRSIPSIPDLAQRAQAREIAMRDPGSRFTLLMTQSEDVGMREAQKSAVLSSSLDEYARAHGLQLRH